MAIYAFYPAASHLRRSDGIGFILAEGADEATARDAAQTLVGGTSIDEFCQWACNSPQKWALKIP